MQDSPNTNTNRFQEWLSTKKGKVILISAASFLVVILLLAVLLLLLPGAKTPAKDEINTLEDTEAMTEPVTDFTPAPDESVTLEEIVTRPSVALPAVADDELRGAYVASVLNINFPSKPGLDENTLKSELDEIVLSSRRAGLDTLFFQVRPTGDALYPSAFFPSSRYLVEKEGDPISFDPLDYLILKAKEYNMDVVAWVNPYRITNFESKTRDAALEALCETNPARLHPEWTVFYGGKLYYNPAVPEVRDLISDGVREICENYEVRGILYDDYFYPYPVKGETFDDGEHYEAYTKSYTASPTLSLEDWRRENVNKMVRQSYQTVKAVSSDLSFGISPFGIWKNASSDPAGSDTKGSEAYFNIYCDALAWIRGGYVDYVAPQIYWERGNSAADFATLTRWWSAQVDGTDVKLYISHAAYKVGDFKLGADEIAQQIVYSRAFRGVSGNIQYGLADLMKNTGGLADRLYTLYREPYHEDAPDFGVKGVTFAYPRNGAKVTGASQFVTIASDPRYPVYSDYGKVGRTKSGLISMLVPLQLGENTVTLTQNGTPYTLTIHRVSSTGTTPK
ncbi:MAG: family 10 glycosylhydrolase, partial [Clostridia bacterium]|nr:family 10 glycosylhydrolase [Clostridia bacterium]